MIHKKQLEVLNYVYKYIKTHKRSPTRCQIREFLGHIGNGSVGRYLQALEDDGFIIRAGTTRGQIAITERGVRVVRRLAGISGKR